MTLAVESTYLFQTGGDESPSVSCQEFDGPDKKIQLRNVGAGLNLSITLLG